MASADPSGILPDLPNGLTFLMLRPLIIPLALVCLGLGFVLWRFMGDVPSVLGMGFQLLADGLRPHGTPPPSPMAHAAIAFPPEAGITAIRAADPTFSEATMLEEVRRIGAVVLDAWKVRDLERCRAVLTDDCWIAQTAQLTRPLAEGWRPYAGTVTLRAEGILSVHREAAGDRVTVRVRQVSDAGVAKVIRGRRISEWVEDWQFVRTGSGPWLLDRMVHVAVHLERAA